MNEKSGATMDAHAAHLQYTYIHSTNKQYTRIHYTNQQYDVISSSSSTMTSAAVAAVH